MKKVWYVLSTLQFKQSFLVISGVAIVKLFMKFAEPNILNAI